MSWDIQQLFRAHAAGISRSLRRLGFSADVAEDLTQDTFLRVIAVPPPAVSDRHHPKAYLYRTSRNLGINHRRRAALIANVDPALLDDQPDDTPLTERIVAAREQLRRVEAALDTMPERTRRAFEMHRMDGMAIAEVASAIGVSPTRAWTLVHQAYRHLLDLGDG